MKTIGNLWRIAAYAIFSTALIPVAHAKYTTPANYGSLPEKTFSNKSGDDSARLQSLIDANKSTGAIITLEPGKYTLSAVTLKSNTHLRFKAGVTINQGSNAIIFTLHDSNGKNMSIVGPVKVNGKVPPANDTISVSFKVARVRECNNFLLDNITSQAHMTQKVMYSTEEVAKNGTISNMKANGNGPGYGLYQGQAGTNIYLKKINSEGGFTLRLEQAGGDSGIGNPWKNISGNNITNRKGRGAVAIIPADVTSDGLNVTNMKSIGSQWGVIISSGKNGGKFKNAKLTDIYARYGTKGQFKLKSGGRNTKDFIPDGLQSKVQTIDGISNGKFATGPSFGCVKDFSGSIYTVNLAGKKLRQDKGSATWPSVYASDPLVMTDSNWDNIANKR